MVAPTTVPSRVPTRNSPAADLALLAPIVLVAATLMLWMLAGWLCLRRWSGALEQPLGFAALGAAGAVAASVVASLRCGWWWLGVHPVRRMWPDAVLWLLPSLAIMLLLAALSFPSSAVVPLLLAWACVLGNEAFWGYRVWHAWPGRSAATHNDSAGSVPDPVLPAVGARAAEAVFAKALIDPAQPLAADVVQHLTRVQSPDHGDTMDGALRAVFPPGQRSRNLHVAFCPPMPGRPQVEVAQVSGPPARVKVADVQVFGIRFDVRLSAASQREEHVLIHFEACWDA